MSEEDPWESAFSEHVGKDHDKYRATVATVNRYYTDAGDTRKGNLFGTASTPAGHSANELLACFHDAGGSGPGNMKLVDQLGTTREPEARYSERICLRRLSAGFYFSNIMVDEGHLLKSIHGAWNRMFRLIIGLAPPGVKTTFTLVSGTPIWNRQSDSQGITALL